MGIPVESLMVPRIAPTDCANAGHATADSSSTGTERRTHERNAAVRGHEVNMKPSASAPYERGSADSRWGNWRARASMGARHTSRDRQSLGAGDPVFIYPSLTSFVQGLGQPRPNMLRTSPLPLRSLRPFGFSC